MLCAECHEPMRGVEPQKITIAFEETSHGGVRTLLLALRGTFPTASTWIGGAVPRQGHMEVYSHPDCYVAATERLDATIALARSLVEGYRVHPGFDNLPAILAGDQAAAANGEPDRAASVSGVSPGGVVGQPE